jgi:hypothetical protein
MQQKATPAQRPTAGAPPAQPKAPPRVPAGGGGHAPAQRPAGGGGAAARHR